MPHEQVGPALRKKRLTGPPEHVRERGLRTSALRQGSRIPGKVRCMEI